jgi:hypothetical protein
MISIQPTSSWCQSSAEIEHVIFIAHRYGEVLARSSLAAQSFGTNFATTHVTPSCCGAMNRRFVGD